MTCADEHSKSRKIIGRRTDVHKVLASASQVCSNGDQLLWLTGDGGFVTPRSGKVRKEMEKRLVELRRQFGDETLLPVYQERGVYNFYMKVDRCDDVAAVANRPSSPFGRLGQHP